MLVGFRNSINKDFAVGLTTGSQVIVYPNGFPVILLCAERHTSGLDDEELSDRDGNHNKPTLRLVWQLQRS